MNFLSNDIENFQHDEVSFETLNIQSLIEMTDAESTPEEIICIPYKPETKWEEFHRIGDYLNPDAATYRFDASRVGMDLGL